MIEVTTITRNGVEHFSIACKNIVFIGETKQGACIQTDLGECYDVANPYKEVIQAYEQATQSAVVAVKMGVDYAETEH